MLLLEYHLQKILQGKKSMQYTWDIDQAFNPDGASLVIKGYIMRKKNTVYFCVGHSGQESTMLPTQVASQHRIWFMLPTHWLSDWSTRFEIVSSWVQVPF